MALKVKTNNNVLIGICGGSGCGKSTLMEKILSELSEKYQSQIVILDFDNYYVPLDNIPLEKRKLFNFDEPDAMDWGLLKSHLRSLKFGRKVYSPVYDFKQYNRTHDEIEIIPNKIILTGGHLIFWDDEIRNMFDLKIFLNVKDDVRLSRRIIRDTDPDTGRGRTVKEVIHQWHTYQANGYREYVCKHKHEAVCFPIGGMHIEGVELIIGYIKTKIHMLMGE